MEEYQNIKIFLQKPMFQIGLKRFLFQNTKRYYNSFKSRTDKKRQYK